MKKEACDHNLILLGGTGARCGEIFVHMCANGYFEADSVNLLYIDSDPDNGNAHALRRVIDLYQDCRARYRIEASPIPCFFRPEIRFETADPVGKTMLFKDIANIGQTDAGDMRAANALMRALYSDEECETKISDGFFARPNVGAALFSASMDTIMKGLLEDVSTSHHEFRKAKIFMIGSLFGGTGASSLPTISRYLKQKLYGGSTDQLIGEKLKIGGCMALPYFAFTKGSREGAEKAQKDDAPIEANKFSTKTRCALEYYKMVDSDDEHRAFDSLYFLGHDGHDVRGLYDTGGSGQRNMPHIVEYYAAMSAVTFFKEPSDGHFFAVVPDGKISWSDFYHEKWCFFYFYVMMRFSIVVKSLILEELFDYKNSSKLKKKAKDIPWFYDFLDGKDRRRKGRSGGGEDRSKDFDENKLFDHFKAISDYCGEYVRWFSELTIQNIDVRLKPHQIQYEDMGMDSDLVDYLDLFSPRLLLSQYTNDLIAAGEISGYMEKIDTYDQIYQDNLAYIREHFPDLDEANVFTDSPTKVTMDKIWTRLSDLGYQRLVKKDNLFKNIAQAESKTMAEGVKNLVNAIYIACMF